MSIPTTRQRCEYQACKNRAITAIAYRGLWGTQLTGTGPIEHFADYVTFRCAKHEDVVGTWGKREIKAYRTAALEKVVDHA